MQRRKPDTRFHRARRLRALDRFTIDTERAAKDPKYAQRKATELASLQASVGTSTLAPTSA